MKYWNNYIDSISQSPKEYYYSLTNAFVANQWHDTTLLSNVKEEKPFGSFKFCDIEVWKRTVSTFTNQIIKDERDFRELMFKNVHHKVSRGTYYQIGNNYFITYEGTNEEDAYSSVLVRRCNNVVKWIDAETGVIHEYPCVLEYDISATTPRIDKDINILNSSVTLVLQGNINTRKIKRNQRFIFNQVPYKFVAFNNYMQNNYCDQDVNLLFMDIDFSPEEPTDDIENGIANRYQYNYEVLIDDAPLAQIQDFEGTLSASVLLNGESLDKPIIWSANKYGKIDQYGNYTLTGIVGKVAQFTATYGSFSKTVDIEIVDNIEPNSVISITPLISELNEQETQQMDVALYVNGIRQNDVPTVITSGVDANCYVLVQDGNIFALTNLHVSNNLLNITFTIRDISKSISIKLKALY